MLVFYPLRLLILGVGMGAIAGTVLANYDSTKVGVAETKPTAKIASDLTYNSPSPLSLGKEIIPLKEKLVQLAAKYPNLTPGIFFVDLDNSAYVSIAGDASFASASTIKIPILVAFFQDVDAGKIRLDQMLTMTEEVMADGSGNMQYEKPGTQFTARETAEKMIVISDNTATNMLIELLGGAEVLNERFGKWGLQNTRINNSLPDLEGTNTTSPWDLAYVLTMVTRGELVSLRSRDRLLNIMRETQTDTLLPQGLETGAVIAHKTGDIGAVLGDAGIVDMVNGKRYIAAVLVKRPHNDYAAKELIQEISRTAYQHFKFYDPRPLTQAGGGS
ncbi:MAG: serine hydrolase [Gomphosphaeria aponina SAG 52.96 = DSM 107014]|uniref:Serine hydrolase n=1 Tax=Gomphosphaeria aponina SAG 52.96 = DSM 107014 TaxID=1521640 RepID=A0A941GSU3_9CHRO|nr:serine hydrolase [Gomphosphaeria aponina SAG 52.96 = DSM 107014]